MSEPIGDNQAGGEGQAENKAEGQAPAEGQAQAGGQAQAEGQAPAQPGGQPQAGGPPQAPGALAAAGHTYLVKPGLWLMEGIFFDREEGRHRQSGQLVVVHSPDAWSIESELAISGEDTRDFLSRYDIEPLAPGAAYTEWKSETGGPEPIFGLFVIVEDAILSPFQSRSGHYWGHETLTRVSPDAYLSRGFAFIKREKVSSWAIKLTRQGQASGG
jgi:hypothetical protein